MQHGSVFYCIEVNGDDNRVECLWVKIRGKANEADIMVGVCYRPPNWDKGTDKMFLTHLEDVI